MFDRFGIDMGWIWGGSGMAWLARWVPPPEGTFDGGPTLRKNRTYTKKGGVPEDGVSLVNSGQAQGPSLVASAGIAKRNQLRVSQLEKPPQTKA